MKLTELAGVLHPFPVASRSPEVAHVPCQGVNCPYCTPAGQQEVKRIRDREREFYRQHGPEHYDN